MGSQIETKWIFSIVNVFTSWQRCHLGVENLDKLIIIYKNLPSDERCDYKLVDGDKLIDFFVVEDTLLEENEDLLEKVSYNLEEVE